jgi:outer membrane protein assembly factor BamB
MHPRHRTVARWLPSLLIVTIALTALCTAVLLFDDAPASGADATPAAAARDTVDLQFQVVDGDSGRAMPNVTVDFFDQTNAPVGAQAVSDAQGRVTLPGVESTTLITAVAQPTGKWVAFPVTAPTFATQPTQIPLYRDDLQWTTWGRTNDRRRVGPPAGKPKGAPIWKQDPRNMLEFPPCLAYGLVVYGSYHGFINASRQSDGELVWTQYPGTAERPSKFANQLAVGSWMENGRRVARVYFAELTGMAGCLDLFTGNYIWRAEKGKGPGTRGKTIPFKSFEASPLLQGETLYLASRYNKKGGKSGLWALDRRTGEVRWFRKLGQTANSKIGASPAYRNGRVFVAAYDGNVYAVNAASGKILWRTKLSGSFYSTPAISGSRLYLGSNSNGVVYCLNTSNGKVVWQRDLGSSVHSSPAVYNNRLFLGVGKTFVAISTRNGSSIWSLPARTKIWGSATVMNGIVYFSDVGKTYGCSASTGKVVWSFKAGRYSPVTATRHLIMVCGKRIMYAFKPSK